MNILAIESSCDETAAAVVKDGHEVLSNVVASQIDIHAKYGGVVPEVAARAHVQAIIPVVEEALRLSACPAHCNGVGVIPTDSTKVASGGIPFSWDNIDAIAVTQGPGLVGSLIVGTETARTLSILKNKPLIAVNHLEGHIYANFIRSNPKSEFLISKQAPSSKSQNKDPHSDHSSVTSALSVIPAPDRVEGKTPAGIQTSKKLDSRLHGNDNVIENDNVSGNNNTSVPQFPLIALLVSGGHTMLIHMKKH